MPHALSCIPYASRRHSCLFEHIRAQPTCLRHVWSPWPSGPLPVEAEPVSVAGIRYCYLLASIPMLRPRGEASPQRCGRVTHVWRVFCFASEEEVHCMRTGFLWVLCGPRTAMPPSPSLGKLGTYMPGWSTGRGHLRASCSVRAPGVVAGLALPHFYTVPVTLGYAGAPHGPAGIWNCTGSQRSLSKSGRLSACDSPKLLPRKTAYMSKDRGKDCRSGR